MAKWRNKITIKQIFTDEPNNNDVMAICEKLIPQLTRIYNNEDDRKQGKLDDYFLDEFYNLIEEFKWVKESIENDLDAAEFSYRDWTEAFNEYLGQLYDVADTMTVQRNWHDNEKFLWVS